MKTYRFNVRFKEAYLPYSVDRSCVARSPKQVIDFYGLLRSDIEWFVIECDDNTYHQDKKQCCICGGLVDEEHTASPVVVDGKCCTLCNWKVVIPTRLKLTQINKDTLP